MSTTARSICVFCGAKSGNDPSWVTEAWAFGHALAARRWTLVYGGGNIGLMGALADGALAGGGEVIGVIPHKLMARELAHRGLARLDVVDDMAQRKTRMIEISDAFVALPGGFGTLDELFEVLTLAQIGYHRKPIALYNQNGYWDTMMTACRHMAENGFVHPGEMALLQTSDTLQGTLAAVAG